MTKFACGDLPAPIASWSLSNQHYKKCSFTGTLSYATLPAHLDLWKGPRRHMNTVLCNSAKTMIKCTWFILSVMFIIPVRMVNPCTQQWTNGAQVSASKLWSSIIKNYEMIQGAQLSNSFILLMVLNEAKEQLTSTQRYVVKARYIKFRQLWEIH
jgi:hypothetical protein